MKDVFISYRRELGEVYARKLYEYLSNKSRGLRVWFDKVDMEDGKPFPVQLETAVRNTPNYVLIATQNVFSHGKEERDWVWKEIETALDEYKKNPFERTLTVLVPHGVEIPTWESLPKEIRDIADVQRIGERTDTISLSFEHDWSKEFHRVFIAVTELNRRNLWYAAHRWYKNSREKGGRFSSLCIDETIMPGTLKKHTRKELPICVFPENQNDKSIPLLEALSSTNGHLYLIGQGGIGKTTALMYIMKQAYDEKSYKDNTQIPIFVELSHAPDSASGQIYANGKSTFIRRSIFRQVRAERSFQIMGDSEVETLTDLFGLPYDFAVRPIVDLLRHNSPAPEYLLLLDGLNEVSTQTIEAELNDGGKTKATVYEMIRGEILWIIENCPNVRIILTSRSDESLISESITKLYLSEIEKSAVFEYLKKSEIDGAKIEESEIDRINNDTELMEILRVPLFLTIYVSLHDRSEVTAAGEILRVFFNERRHELPDHTIKDHLTAIEKNVISNSAGFLVGRITSDIYDFILDFILPEVAWNIERNGEFLFSARTLRKVIIPILKDRTDLSICGDFGKEAFTEYLSSDTRTNTYATAKKLLAFSDDESEINELILDVCVNVLGILHTSENKYGFVHQHIRDFFAAVKIVNAMRLSLYLFEESEKQLALDCINRVFYDKPVSLPVRRFVGEYLGEHKNKPFFNAGKWNYGVPIEHCERNYIDRLFDVFRGDFDCDGYSIYNLVEITKLTRKDLAGIDFHDLLMLNVTLNGTSIGKKGLGSNFTGTLISKKNIFSYGHINIVYSVSFSPDGKKILSVSEDNSAIIWDAQTGLIIDEFIENTEGLDGIEYGINAGVFSPDGSKIAITMESGETDIRSGKGGKLLTSFYGNYSGSARFSVFSPSGKRIATTYENGTIIVRNSEDGRDAFVYDGRLSEAGYNTSTNYSVFNKKNNSFIAITKNGVVVWKKVDPYKTIKSSSDSTNYLQFPPIWRPKDAVLYTLSGQNEAIFSPDGEIIASASHDNKVIVFDAFSGHLIKELGNHKCDIQKMIFSRDGSRLASVSTDYTIQIWDMHKLCRINEWRVNVCQINDIAFSFDNTMLFVVSNNIAAWDVLKAKELIIRKDIGKVNSITVSTVNEMFATAHKDASVKVWNQINGSLALCLEGHLNEVGDIVICEKHKLLIFIKLDTLYAWNYDNQQMAYVIMNNKPIKTMIISHNQEYLLISSHQNRADILSIKDGILKSTIVDNECGFEMFEMSYDGNHAVTVSNEGKIIIWNVKTGKPFKYLANKAREPICLKMVEHNQTVFTIGKNGQIEKWDYNNTVCIYRKKYCNECIIVDADFCEKISRAIAVTSEGKAILIDTEDGSIVSSICMKPSIALDSCRFKTEFSPNEETFLLYDGFTIQIFDSLSGEEIKQNGVKLKQNIIGFNCYFTPRGNHIIVETKDFAGFNSGSVSIAKNEIWDLKANVIIQDMEFLGVVKMAFNPNMDKILIDSYSGGLIFGDLVAENWPSKYPYIRNEVEIENVYGLNMVDTNFNGSINDFSDEDKSSLRKYGAIID